MRLTGRQHEQFKKALLKAFPNRTKLRQLLLFSFEKNIDVIAGDGPLEEVVFNLIVATEAEGWTFKLINAACQSNPGSLELLAFTEQFGLAHRVSSSQVLERIINKAKTFIDPFQWRTKMGEMEARVCCIEVELDGEHQPFGTGFLVGQDIVITNHHVIEPVISGSTDDGIIIKPSDVVLRFDYKKLLDGQTISRGTKYHLIPQGWLIDYSPKSPADDKSEPKMEEPQPDELDYALLRVDGNPSKDTVGKTKDPEAPERGYIKIPTKQKYNFVSDSDLLILQYPKGDPLKLAFDTVRNINGNQTRVTYTTNTERGSSGSPCFNIKWELVALHHARSPISSQVSYNQGIPFAAILDLLHKRDIDVLSV